jgi:hypothetical protein
LYFCIYCGQFPFFPAGEYAEGHAERQRNEKRSGKFQGKEQKEKESAFCGEILYGSFPCDHCRNTDKQYNNKKIMRRVDW